MLLWRHLSFLKTIIHISNSIEPTNFVLGINTQQYNVHLIINKNDLNGRKSSQAKVKGHKKIN